MTRTKFLPSGHTFVVPLQYFTRSASGTSANLLLDAVTIAMFLTAASVDAVATASAHNVAHTRSSFAEILACMTRFTFQKECTKYCRSQVARQVSLTHFALLYRICHSI
jgi:hypothetical protein